jgi:hypothetical protein
MKLPPLFSEICDTLRPLSMESNFWELVLITLNERPMEVLSGFFVGRAKLKSKA